MFRCDAGLTVGTGHFARCVALASWLDHEEVGFVVAADAEGRRAVATASNTRCLPLELSEGDEAMWWRRNVVDADAVVFDLSYPARVSRRAATRELMREIGGHDTRRIAIDAFGAQVLVDDDAWPLDAIIIPYAGARVSCAAPPTLAGVAYFILPRDWSTRPARDGGGPVRRLVVTMGGSDPLGLTIRVLEAIAWVAGADWSVRAVIGRAFTSELAEAIRTRAGADPRIEPIEAPASLAPHLAWADLAVAATGLTKYELAWAGVPSVQISINRLHAELNASFAAEDTALHLGAADGVETSTIAAAVVALAADGPRRAAMSRRGQALVDGQGGLRVAHAIRELIDARP